MLGKILKNRIYLTMIIGVLIALVSFVCCFFIKNRAFFTIMFIVNICTNFLVSAIILLSNGSSSINFKWLALYLLTTLFILLIDVRIIGNIWDLNNYSNLMYVKNIELYLGLYSIYVLIMVLMGIYVVLRGINAKEKNTI